jgi:hypothetical protein
MHDLTARLGEGITAERVSDMERRSEVLALWWAEWLRVLPFARAAGVTLTDLRLLRPPID